MNRWIEATRPWSFPASTMPALIALAFAQWSLNGNTHLLAGLAAVAGAFIFQISGNLISDYFDYRSGVDSKDTFGSSRMIVDGVFKPRTIWLYGMAWLALGCMLGLWLTARSGWALLAIGAAGALGTYFYYTLKYHALGDVLIFLIYGQLIPLGAYYCAAGGAIDWRLTLVTTPIGFMIVNILHANNTRDTMYDSRAGISTLAMRIGLRWSKRVFAALAYSSYAILALCVALGWLPWPCLVMLATTPLAVKNVKWMMRATGGDGLKTLRGLDGACAQLVLVCGVLQAAVLTATYFFA
ncbi:MAG: prenyltransferase [Bacteroidales bacterium]|nr:prenyltransferase [Bacteroidales bacterium]MDY3912099.1 prenyltransferase [Sodaliphilus sp.]